MKVSLNKNWVKQGYKYLEKSYLAEGTANMKNLQQDLCRMNAEGHEGGMGGGAREVESVSSQRPALPHYELYSECSGKSLVGFG